MSTSTAQYFNTGPYHEVISGISTVFSFSDGVVKLTGPLGAGKTSLLRELAKELRAESFEVVEFQTPPKSPEDFQTALIRQFRLGADLSFRKSLIRYLSTKPRDLQKLILLLDDAEEMSVDTLNGLHALRDLEHNGQALISALLCGDKSLNAVLAKPELAAVQADITLNYVLNPLDENELAEFCSHYLQQTGRGRVILSPDYLESLLLQTRGLPGAVLEELGRAVVQPDFLQLYTRLAPPEPEAPEPALIGQVISNISEKIDNIPPETKRWLKPTAGVLFTAAALSTAYTYYPRVLTLYNDFRGTGTSPELAGQPAPVEPAPQPAQTPVPAPAQPSATPPTQPATQPPAQTQAQAQAPAPAPAAPAAPQAPATPAPPPVQQVATAPAPAAPAVAAPAAPAPKPVVAAAPPAPAVSVPAVNNADLAAAVANWASAWQRQDTQAYFSYYHTDFAPLYHDSLRNWRADRMRSLTRPPHIDLKVSDLEVGGSDATGTTVRFWLTYEAPGHADRTYKELVFGQDQDGKLRILRELNKETETLPAGSLAAAPGASPASGAPATVAGLATQTQIGQPINIRSDAAVSGLANDHDNVNAFVTSWLNAWQHKDLQDYFRHYHPDFKAPLMASTAAWREDRILKITRPPVIQLQLERMELLRDEQDEMVLRLTLAYHSSFYADRTQKELRLQRGSAGDLQIVEEKNLAVENLPLARLLPTNLVALLELARAFVASRL